MKVKGGGGFLLGWVERVAACVLASVVLGALEIGAL
jgi:hypothetical protein